MNRKIFGSVNGARHSTGKDRTLSVGPSLSVPNGGIANLVILTGTKPDAGISLNRADTWDLIDYLTELAGERPVETFLDQFRELPIGAEFRTDQTPALALYHFVKVNESWALKVWDFEEERPIAYLTTGFNSDEKIERIEP